jgi:uncharacterized membrane protein (UPF0127 family)
MAWVKYSPRNTGPLLLAMLLLTAWPAMASGPIDSAQEQLNIRVSADSSHTFRVHIARTQDERARGLMYVRKMSEDVGMLFLYDKPTSISMWMKNTYIPLDMIFIGPDGRILNIAEDTIPHSLQSVRSMGQAIAVLEINAGLSRKLGLAPGQVVQHKLLPSAAKVPANATDSGH